MKKIIATLFGLLVAVSAFGQTLDKKYPVEAAYVNESQQFVVLLGVDVAHQCVTAYGGKTAMYIDSDGATILDIGCYTVAGGMVTIVTRGGQTLQADANIFRAPKGVKNGFKAQE